jgi:hypothetical protein
MGKKEIALDSVYKGTDAILDILLDKKLRTVLMPWTVNLQAGNLQHLFIKALQARSDLQIDFIADPANGSIAQLRELPKSRTLFVPKSRIKRLWAYFKMRNRYDMVIQSDYQAIIPLSWVAKDILFINYEGISVRKRANLADIYGLMKTILTLWRQT